MLILLMLIIMAACVAALYLEGMWGNIITLMNVIVAALAAFNLFQWLGGVLEGMMPSMADKVDFIALWGLFFVFMGILRAVTDLISRVKVRFFKPVEMAGGVFFSLWVGWVMVCFTMASLHVAPLPRTSFFGGFMAEPDDTMLVVGPDRLWLGFVHNLSGGALGRWTEKPFDKQGDFIYTYAARRASFEVPEKKGAR